MSESDRQTESEGERESGKATVIQKPNSTQIFFESMEVVVLRRGGREGEDFLNCLWMSSDVSLEKVMVWGRKQMSLQCGT